MAEDAISLPVGSVDFNALHDVLMNKKAKPEDLAAALAPVSIGGIEPAALPAAEPAPAVMALSDPEV